MKTPIKGSRFAGALAVTWALAGCGTRQEPETTASVLPANNGQVASATDNASTAPATAGAAPGTPQPAGPFQVTLSLAPDEPTVGDARFQAKVTQGGKPVPDATIRLGLSMPAMNMGGPSVALKHAGGGLYAGTANLSMGGAYQAQLAVSQGGRAGTAVYHFTASQP